MAAAQMSSFAEVHLDAIASENTALVRQLGSFDPLKAATTFGGLLTVADLQSNCIRLEVLAHLALACGKGQRKPPGKFVARAFAALGRGLCGRLEDPAEDMFVA